MLQPDESPRIDYSKRIVSLAAALLLLLGGGAAAISVFLVLSEDGGSVETDSALILDVAGDVPDPVRPVQAATPEQLLVTQTARPDSTTSHPATVVENEPQVPGALNQPERREPSSFETPVPPPVPALPGLNSNHSIASGSGRTGSSTIRIPAISVEASIVPVGVNERGEMASPDSVDEVGWWRFGAKLGEIGKAVLAGHLDSLTGAAIFYKLDRLEPGDTIFIQSDDGAEERRFIVRGTALYRLDAAPVDAIFGESSQRELILITCGGAYDARSLSYVHRRVIFAVAVGDQYQDERRG